MQTSELLRTVPEVVVVQLRVAHLPTRGRNVIALVSERGSTVGFGMLVL